MQIPEAKGKTVIGNFYKNVVIKKKKYYERLPTIIESFSYRHVNILMGHFITKQMNDNMNVCKHVHS
jgi:hypothetical protein